MTDDSGDDERAETAEMYGDPADMYDSGDGSSTADSDGPAGTAGASEEESPDESPGFDDQLVSAGGEEPEPEAGTFYVKHVEDVAITLHEVHTGQIFTVIENPGLERREIIEATLVAQPPMQVSYLIDELQSRRTLPVEVSAESPTRQATTVAADLAHGDAVAIDREGEGEIHVIKVDPDQLDETVEEVADDEMTYKNAARYGVTRVEIRSDEDDGVVTIRYLPD